MSAEIAREIECTANDVYRALTIVEMARHAEDHLALDVERINTVLYVLEKLCSEAVDQLELLADRVRAEGDRSATAKTPQADAVAQDRVIGSTAKRKRKAKAVT